MLKAVLFLSLSMSLMAEVLEQDLIAKFNSDTTISERMKLIDGKSSEGQPCEYAKADLEIILISQEETAGYSSYSHLVSQSYECALGDHVFEVATVNAKIDTQRYMEQKEDGSFGSAQNMELKALDF